MRPVIKEILTIVTDWRELDFANINRDRSTGHLT